MKKIVLIICSILLISIDAQSYPLEKKRNIVHMEQKAENSHNDNIPMPILSINWQVEIVDSIIYIESSEGGNNSLLQVKDKQNNVLYSTYIDITAFDKVSLEIPQLSNGSYVYITLNGTTYVGKY